MMRCFAALAALFLLPAFAAKIETEAERRWWAHIEFLANDDMKGRNTGSPEHLKAAQYVAAQFERAGLKPGAGKSYIQPVKFTSRQIVEERSSMSLIRDGMEEPLVLGEDATLGLRITPSPSIEAPLVFAGYGLRVPERKYDDFSGLDVKGKVIVILLGGPSEVAGNLRSHYQSAGERSRVLRETGAIGMIGLSNPKNVEVPWSRSSLARLMPSMSLADAALDESGGVRFSATFNHEKAAKLFAGSGHAFEDLVAGANAGKQLPRFPLPVSLKARVAFDSANLTSQNVVGVIPGTDSKLNNEYVVFSAHVDHIGVGKPINGDAIFNGAMDNASGIASMIEIAAQIRASKKTFRRSLLFVAVTGEEKGLLGSKYFAGSGAVADKTMVANINLDMFLPLFPLKILTAMGYEESTLGDILVEVAGAKGIRVEGDPEPDRNRFIRSDQYNFIKKGVPALAFKVGFEKGSPEEKISKDWYTNRYHAPSDDLNQPVDLKAAVAFNDLMAALMAKVADAPERPRWKEQSFFRRYAAGN